MVITTAAKVGSLFVILSLHLSSLGALAQCELTKIVGTGGLGGSFGRIVKASGKLLVVADGSEQTLVFRRSQGLGFDQTFIIAPEGSLDLSVNFALDGERVLNGTVGLAYVFEWNGVSWYVAHQLTTADDFFLAAARVPFPAISGDVLVLGAMDADDACGGDPNCNSGAAYVFRWNGSAWIEEQKLTASNALQGDRFGHRVITDQDRIVVQAIQGNALTGSAYVFVWNGNSWDEQAELTPSDGTPYDRFGESMAIDGNRIVVGEPLPPCNLIGDPCDTGSVYVYDWDGADWNESQILTASNAQEGDRFGASVALSGDILLVGAPKNPRGFGTTGAVFLFRKVGSLWVEQERMTASDASASDEFGISVAMSGGLAYVGAEDANGGGGAVYMFGVDGDCDEDGEIDTCEILADSSLDLNGNLQLDLCDHSIPTVSAWGVVAMALLLLAAGSVVMQRRVRLAG